MSTPAISSTSHNDTLPFLLGNSSAPREPTIPTSIPLERPTLTRPTELRFLNVTGNIRQMGDKFLSNLTDRLTLVKQNIEEISSEHIQKLKETAEKANSSHFWSVLKKIATALVSAFSVVFGISLLAGGGAAGVVGGTMIASGVLSLANFALTELKIWDWVAEQIADDNKEQQQRLAMILPAAAGILCGGIGLLGAGWGIGSNAIEFSSQLVQVAQTSLNFLDGVTTLGKGCADASLLWTQADLTLIDGKLTQERSYYELLIEGIKSCMSDFRSVSSKAKQTLKIVTASNIQLVR